MRVIARRIAPERYGKPYDELNEEELFECAAEATKIRLQRLKEELERLLRVPNLPAQDRRQSQLSSVLKKAREAHAEAI
jgi:hypothetical protein